MEMVEDIVIVGSGIAGLTTSLGLHRLGYRSLVLESSDSLRVSGFALITWTNAWKVLDALGIGDSLRQHQLLHENVMTTMNSGSATSVMSLKSKGKFGDHEVRCVRRAALLEALGKELPVGTIRYSSKVVNIEESGYLKLVHLADGTILKTKVLIGCDGVNSVVAKWLGFKKPTFSGRSALRGKADFNAGHGFDPNFFQFVGEGVRVGFLPLDEKFVYWFVTYTPSNQDKEMEDNPLKMKQYILSKLGKGADNMVAVLENTGLDTISPAPLRYRHPWEFLWGNISKGNVCVAGDALHPMTPDLGQGGCSALEDGVVLARCLAEALSKKPNAETKVEIEKDEYYNIKVALEKYASERKWRGFNLTTTSYLMGVIQQSSGILGFLRDKFLSKYLAGLLLKKADFDFGKL